MRVYLIYNVDNDTYYDKNKTSAGDDNNLSPGWTKKTYVTESCCFETKEEVKKVFDMLVLGLRMKATKGRMTSNPEEDELITHLQIHEVDVSEDTEK